ncbi:hypothetical protein FACS1894181_05890 [Bacteroidia bacterium]|nr:hypothetical protein FACS1894181_05890 [Bacteroidia bacterium]
MGKYYYLIAGLPNIAFDDGKLPYTVLGFKDELVDYLSKADARLLELFFLKIDNRNLLKLMQYPGYDPEPGGKIAGEEISGLLDGLKNEKEEEMPFKNKNKRLPAYFETFARMYAEAVEKEEKAVIPWEDRLSALYYEHAMKCTNPFVSSWFELNLNINNILAALACRKYKLERENYIVGQTEAANKLRSSSARDFGLGDSLDYLPALLRAGEDAELLQREKKVDALKWEWLGERTFARVFDVESVLAYLLKLEILERWNGLDKATGEKTFRQLVGTMKTGSGNALEEFKRNNKK